MRIKLAAIRKNESTGLNRCIRSKVVLHPPVEHGYIVVVSKRAALDLGKIRKSLVEDMSRKSQSTQHHVERLIGAAPTDRRLQRVSELPQAVYDERERLVLCTGSR